MVAALWVSVHVCARVGEIKDMTWGNDAKFHLFVFFSSRDLVSLKIELV